MASRSAPQSELIAEDTSTMTSFLGKFSGRKGQRMVTPKGVPVFVPLVCDDCSFHGEKEHGEPAFYRRHIKVMPYNTQRRLWPPLVLELPPPLMFRVCMILPGGECRLQTCRGLATQLFDSTLRTILVLASHISVDLHP